MPIVTVPTGNDYSAMTAELINAAWDQANAKVNSFESKLTGATNDWLDTANAPHITAGTAFGADIAEPGVTIPASADVGDVMSTFDTKYLELVAMLSDKYTGFLTTYFPNDTAIYSAAETWLQSAITNDTGLPATVADQLMTDSRDKLLADANRASDAVLTKFAAMRFPLPPGAAASAVLQIQQTAQDKIAEAERKIVVASVEQLRWTVEKLIDLRKTAAGSAIEYIKALASGPDMASRLINFGYDAQSKLISAASQFYGVRAEVAKIANQNAQFNVSTALEAATKNQSSDLALIEDRLKALLTECQALATMATSLFNNLHASAGVSASDSVNTSI